MRILMGRRDWRPSFRIEGLLRYAFIGDSFAYGSGVAPDQTLAANAEQQMNELMPALPAEAVNFGVGGYNLWNSWLDFKREPSVYDGLVFSLCNNDADLFDRSYRVTYSEPHVTRWEHTHPIGVAVARSFDDIVLFSQEYSLPAAIVYFNAYQDPRMLRVAQIIGDLCAQRGLCFIDTFACYRDRNFALADLHVSSANGHPSAMAHEAVARHLVATLKQQGWFRDHEAGDIASAPERILKAARAMIEIDHYPPDVALQWALRALDAKSRLARRVQPSGDDFGVAATRVEKTLIRASRRWHMINRTRALVEQIATSGRGITHGLTSVQDERGKLEELCFVLGMGDWKGLMARLLDIELSQQTGSECWSSDAPAFLDDCSRELVRLQDVLTELRNLAEPDELAAGHHDSSIFADLECLSQLAGRTRAECEGLKAVFLDIENIFRKEHLVPSDVDVAKVTSLIGASFKRVKEGLNFVSSWLVAAKNIRDADFVSFTTVEVTISGAMEDKGTCLLTGMVEYNAPNRLPFANTGAFWLDGSPNIVKLYFPLFYSGRITFRTARLGPIEVQGTTLIKVVFYNCTNQRRSVDPTSFYKDQAGRFVSPFVYLS